MDMYSPKSKIKSMNFSKTTSTNLFSKSTKSTKLQNTSRNIQSFSNNYGSSTESLRSLKNLPLSNSHINNLKLIYPIYKRNFQNYKRNKSSIIIKRIKQYENYYRKTMHNKMKLYNNKKKIRNETPIILYDRRKRENKFIEKSESEKQCFTSLNTSRRNFTKIFNKTKITSYNNRVNYIDNVKKMFKGNYILLTQKNKYQDILDLEKYKVESVNNYSYQIQENKKLLEIYFKGRNKYIKHLNTIISNEQEVLIQLLNKKQNLLINNKKTIHKIEEIKNTINFYKGYKILIDSIFKNNKEILSDPNIIFDKIVYLERNNLELLKKYNRKKEILWELKKELINLTKLYDSSYKSLDIAIKNKEILVERLKENYLSLKKQKEDLEIEIKKNAINILDTKKKNKIKKLNLIEVAELDAMINESKFNKLFKKFPLHFTCLAFFISNLLKIIKEKTPEFLIFNDNTFIGKIFLNLNVLDRIANTFYTKNNLNQINENILIMLIVIEKSVEALMKKINCYRNNIELSKYIKKKLKQKELERKIKNISQKDNIKQEFRNEILNKLKEKQNKYRFINRRVFSNSPPFNTQPNKTNNNYSRKEKEYNIYSTFEDIQILHK